MTPLIFNCGPSLCSLRVVASQCVTRDFLKLVAACCPCLKGTTCSACLPPKALILNLPHSLPELDISLCNKVHSGEFVVLHPMAHQLELLYLARTNISRQEAKMLIRKAGTSLRHLDISDCPLRPDEMCHEIAANCG